VQYRKGVNLPKPGSQRDDNATAGATALNVAQQAFINTQNQGIPVNQPLIDQQRIGSFWARVGVSIPQTGISLPHSLGRQPSGFIVVNDQTGAVIYQSGTDLAASTPSVIVVRAKNGNTVGTLLIL
jgi:hypothetical protein